VESRRKLLKEYYRFGAFTVPAAKRKKDHHGLDRRPRCDAYETLGGRIISLSNRQAIGRRDPKCCDRQSASSGSIRTGQAVLSGTESRRAKDSGKLDV
jgi:hypothetical protein